LLSVQRFGLKFVGTYRFPDTLFNFSCGFVGHPGGLIRVSTHFNNPFIGPA
jgi:hypothetical protein